MLSMKPVRITNRDATREALIGRAKEIPGAWIGVKIAVLLLIKSGYRPAELNRVFGLSRQTMTRWVHELNEDGLGTLEKTPPPGRPSRLSDEQRDAVARDLRESPASFGMPRGRWNGRALQMHLKKEYGVDVKIRQARNYFNELAPEDALTTIRILGKEINI